MKKIFEVINSIDKEKLKKIINESPLIGVDSFDFSTIITLIDISKNISPNINESILSIHQSDDKYHLKLGKFDLDDISLNEFLGMSICNKTIDKYNEYYIVFIILNSISYNLSDILVCFNHSDMLDILTSIDDNSYSNYHISKEDYSNILNYIKSKIN